jgi:hypothetical protein
MPTRPVRPAEEQVPRLAVSGKVPGAPGPVPGGLGG